MTRKSTPRIQSQALINLALKDYRGPSYVSPPKEVIKSDAYDTLTREQTDQAVVAFVHACNLSGGSMGDMDMYKLVHYYLHHPKARSAMNEIVKQYE